MDKKQIIEDFMSDFNRYLNISSFYAKDHPLFLKAVDEFKGKVERVLEALNVVRIGVTFDSLVIDEMNFSGPQFRELAKRLHLRRVKVIEMRRGVTAEDITFLLNVAATPLKDLHKAGGMKNVIKNANTSNLSIQELDYSQLLKTKTGEHKQIWPYLLAEASDNRDSSEISQLSQDFGRMIQCFSPRELLEDEETISNINKFLDYLRQNEKEKFIDCSRQTWRRMLSKKDDLSKEDIEKIKKALEGFSEQELAGIFAGELLSADEIDNFNIELFSGIFSMQKHQKVASGAAEIIKDNLAQDKRKILDKINRLFSASDTSSVSQVYRNTLMEYLKNISPKKEISFDRKSARENYRMILLDLLGGEEGSEKINCPLAVIGQEFKELNYPLDFGFVRRLFDILNRKKELGCLETDEFKLLEKEIAVFVENSIWEQPVHPDCVYMADNLRLSELGMDVYLYRIFKDNKINPLALKLFFKFFPDAKALFYKKMDARYADIEFINTIIKVLQDLGSSRALEMLEHIYLFSNNYLKVEALKAMRAFNEVNKDFLLSVLEERDGFLKKEALFSLIKEESVLKEALDVLLCIKSPWGRQNAVIFENMLVVEELDLKIAEKHLREISKKHFFWNWGIRKKAREILNKWKQ